MTSAVTISENAREQVQCLKEASDSLRQAMGGTMQLAHAHRNPNFLIIKQGLEVMQEMVMVMTQFRTRVKGPVQ